ncbi:ATP-binding protein [Rhizobium mayense]|uniref:sensor histidine kinase n=1 Tax=Rhizobium mayense TaxID=1312184 RepID=UPI00398C7D09
MFKIPFVLIIALLLHTGMARTTEAAETPVREVPTDLSGALPLDGFISVALVGKESTTLDDLLGQQAAFAPIPGHDINLGFVQTSAWLRLALTLPTAAREPRNVVLSITPNFTDELEAYVGLEKEALTAADFRRQEMGDHFPRSDANLNTSANILPLDLSPGQVTLVYIRARNQDASLNVSVELLSPDFYQYRAITQNVLRGMWFGGMAILIVIQLFFFYFDNRKLYLFIALDILAVSSTYFGSLGLARLLFFTSGGLANDYFTSASSWFGLTFGALSIAAVLDLRPRYPLINLFFRFAALIGGIGVICVFLGFNRYFVLAAGPVILVITTFSVIVALMDFHRLRDAQNGLKLAAFGLLWAGLIATNSQRYGIFPLPGWVAGSYAAASIMHLTLLTGSLAVRLRNAEAAARKADRRALELADAAEQRANDLVEERTHELEEAKRVAENALGAELQAQELQVRFMEVISHQYRTPLSVVRTNLESIELILPKDDKSNRERLARARKGIMRLVEVLEVNLTRSKLQGATYQPALRDAVVADIVESALKSARDLLNGIDLTVSMTADAGQARIRADSEMLQLAIINLLENAFKFTAPVGSTSVWLDVILDSDGIRICVKDRGIGIDGGRVEELVRNLVRGPNTNHIPGTGIGLSLVKRATDVHGGRFLLRNRAEGGTEAEIILPALK